jgi:sugar lactone lactonase YvrE
MRPSVLQATLALLLAFAAAAGNLWVANNGRSNLLAFTPAQLAGAGPLEPSVVITSSGSLGIPIGLAFEEDGSLWVVGGTGSWPSSHRRASAGAGQ